MLNENIEVLFDDRQVTAGVKFADASENKVEIKRRSDGMREMVGHDVAVAKLKETIASLFAEIDATLTDLRF